ncbi:MAG: bifunctional phosphoglucose/phosphomannose isomerase [Calditrichaeota bacterium]|nr:MAG: bifunctional phosphoglucose/phosphomannose isomerase [Calditrichota bacterium]
MPELNPSEIAKYDTSDMLGKILNFPQQLQEAQNLARGVKVQVNPEKIANICITGMGGSAISGDLVRTYLAERIRLPIFVNRYYRLPHFVNDQTLVIASSYSGNTEETLESYEDASERGAQIVCVTSGGQLAERAAARGISIYKIPTGFPPRSALGYLTVPLLYCFHNLNLISDPAGELQETIDLLNNLKEEYKPEIENNLAKEISRKLHNKIPLVYAPVNGFEAVAWRWKGQFSENSKVLAFCNLFPELNHNEIMGWGPLKSINREFQVVYLKDKEAHPQVLKRMEITKEILANETDPIIEVESRGKSLLARIFSLIYTGDMVSFYLAILNKEDPTPVKKIDYLKARLTR